MGIEVGRRGFMGEKKRKWRELTYPTLPKIPGVFLLKLTGWLDFCLQFKS